MNPYLTAAMSVQERVAAVMQTRLSWPKADAIAGDLYHAGLLRDEGSEARLSGLLADLTQLRDAAEWGRLDTDDESMPSVLLAATKTDLDTLLAKYGAQS